MNLTKSWLADQIGKGRAQVHRWLDPEKPIEPRDPGVWERMTNVILQMGRPRAPLAPELRQQIIDLGLAVLEEDFDVAKKIAPRIIREISRPYGEGE